MATCPQGHASGDDEYCDTCGAQMAAAPAASAAPAEATPAVDSCPICQAPRAGQFCEVCGHDYTGASGPVIASVAGVRWEAVTAADRAYYDEVIAEGGPDASAVAFPPYCPQRSFALAGDQVRIGRRSRARGVQPEIDLTGPPEDPGVSHLHAVLLAQQDGSWTLVDPGSANGTRVNGKTLTVNVPVPVGAGDRVHLGAWTVITIREGTP
ncbi:FHA domain-containing protein [Nonomuraea sp. NPDC005983]|uniref:FHA domain-containing protein n=1 Tax=Nonomuraea sp. NPDC005983 TaxID=3155595 RepID=UPI0033AD3A13